MDTVKKNKLALELASKLNDINGLKSFRKMTEQFSERYLREKLEITLSMKNIRNKAAYFTSLVYPKLDREDRDFDPDYDRWN